MPYPGLGQDSSRPGKGGVTLVETSTMPDAKYLDPEHIAISAKTAVEPMGEELRWGRQLLDSLDFGESSPYARARAIQRQVSRTLKYRISSPRAISEIVARRGGNCVSHSIMGLFLLRMAGVASRLCYEYHIRNHFPIDERRASRQRAAHFGANHNSHFWVMFHDGAGWQPYDSALGLVGWDEFYATRTRTQRWPYTLSFDPRRMTGAPFIVEVETGTGRTAMASITAQVWSRPFAWGNEKVSRDEWLEFVNGFEGRATGDFRFPLDAETKTKLRDMSRKWF